MRNFYCWMLNHSAPWKLDSLWGMFKSIQIIPQVNQQDLNQSLHRFGWTRNVKCEKVNTFDSQVFDDLPLSLIWCPKLLTKISRNFDSLIKRVGGGAWFTQPVKLLPAAWVMIPGSKIKVLLQLVHLRAVREGSVPDLSPWLVDDCLLPLYVSVFNLPLLIKILIVCFCVSC